MKKFFKTVVCFLVVASALFAFACGRDETVLTEATKYGVVYSHYVCAANVRLENGAIRSVAFEEAETPYSWARLSNILTEINEADTTVNTAYEGAGANNDYARRIAIAGTVFEARDNGEASSYVDYFNASENGATPFEIWLEGSDNAKWYFESIAGGDYDVLREDGSPYNVVFKAAASGELSRADRWLKSKNGYWPASETRKGWQANMNAMSDYIIAHGFADYESERDTLETGEGEVEIKGVKTGATVAFFKDYMDIAMSANNEAVATHKQQTETGVNLFITPTKQNLYN